MHMNRHINALIVEDAEDDALLLVRELQRNGYTVNFRRIDLLPEIEKALSEDAWDIVFCDFTLPHISGTDVLRIVREKHMDIPFIFVSGTMGEDIAVAAMRAGAHDYLTKGNLKRLAPAVDRELRESEMRKEHWRARQALDAAHAQLKQLFDTLDEEFFSFDVANNKLLLISPACERIYGIPPEEFIRNPAAWHNAVHPDDRHLVNFLDADLLKGKSLTVEHRIIRPDGEIRWLEARMKPSRDARGRVIRLDGVVADITERKRSEVLQNALYRIAQAEDVSPTLADLFHSVHQIVQEVMPARNFAIALIDETSGQVRYPYLVDEVDTPPAPGEAYAGLTAYVLRTGVSLLCDSFVHQQLVDQEEIPRLPMAARVWLGVPLIVERRTIGALAIQHYENPHTYTVREQLILEYVCLELAKAIQRKQAEEKLRQSEEHFRLITENVADLIAVLDREGRRLYTSPSYAPILGDPKTLVGNDAFQEIHEADREQVIRLFHEIRDTGKAGRAEFRLHATDGTIRHIDSQWSTVRNGGGTVGQIIVVSRDITEQRRFEQQMLRAQRMESIGTLAGGIAHDLNNVLSPIMMAIDILRRQYSGPAGNALLDTLEASANRGASIVKQVLTFARGVAGERIDLQPAHLIREIEKIVRQTFPKSIDIVIDLPTDLWTITGDPTQIHQVLLNLCVNARDAMQNGGVLTLKASNIDVDDQRANTHEDAEQGPHVVLEVADTGTGIPPDILEKIFEPFFTTKELGKGTGLGLSTVQAIVRSHGGFINVYSEAAKGTRFSIYLPARTSMSQPLDPGTRISHPMGNGELVLVIDDEASIRQITRETLESHNYTVLTAADGAEAISLYVRRTADVRVVITDMMMPYMDGVATIRAFRKVNPRIKIIASSGLSEEMKSLQELGLPVEGFLPKPYTAGMLLNMIHTTLGR